MSSIVRLSLIEFKKIYIRPAVYIGILIAVFLSAGVAYQSIQNPKIFQLRHVYALFANVAEIIIFLYASKSLGDDFQFGTSTLLFTNTISRLQILISKIISLAIFGLSLGVVSVGIAGGYSFFTVKDVSVTTLMKDLSVVLLIYCIYAFCIGSFGLLVSICTQSIPVSVVACIGGFWIAPSIIGFLIQKTDQLKYAVRVIPFYSASSSLTYHTFGYIEIIGLIVGGSIFLTVSAFILNKRDLR